MVTIRLYHNGVQGIQYNLDDIQANNYKLVEEFSKKNNLILNIIDGGEHELFNYVDIVSNLLVKGVYYEEKV